MPVNEAIVEPVPLPSDSSPLAPRSRQHTSTRTPSYGSVPHRSPLQPAQSPLAGMKRNVPPVAPSSKETVRRLMERRASERPIKRFDSADYFMNLTRASLPMEEACLSPSKLGIPSSETPQTNSSAETMATGDVVEMAPQHDYR